MTEMKILCADEGKVLTDNKVYGKVIKLPNSAKADNFYEITDEEYQAILKEKDSTITE